MTVPRSIPIGPLNQSAHRVLVPLIGGTLTVACFKQTAPDPLKNFRKYSGGQWTQVGTGTVDGHVSAPVANQGSETPRDSQGFALAAMLDDAFGTLCRTLKVADTERLFEDEQTCKIGATGTQVTHMVGRVVDDRTMTVDTRLSVGDRPDSLKHATLMYTGVKCTAPTASKPSAAECVQVPTMKSRSSAGSDLRAEMSPQYRAQCEALVTAARKAMAAIAERCK